MWGNDYRWVLRLDAQAAHDRLVRATRPAKPRLFPVLPTSPFDEDKGVINGVIGDRDFSLRFIPYRVPGRVGVEGEDMGEDNPDDTVRVVNRPISALEYWISPETTFVGTITKTASGCIVRGGFRPGGTTLFWQIVFIVTVLSGVFTELGWPVYFTALAILPVLVAGYWLAAVLSDNDKRGRGVLRFLDETLAYAIVKRPEHLQR